MIIVISPAKSLDTTPIDQTEHTIPALKTDANKLSKILKGFSKNQLQDLMHISENLAEENKRRYKQFRIKMTTENSKRAIDTFVGDVYRGLDVSDFTKKDYEYAQDHLRILSGLYGVLRPLDLIQPYRLEMGTKLKNEKGKNLYDFWGNKVTKEINKALVTLEQKTLINLASDEYFKSINTKKLKANIIKANFKEWRNGSLQFVSFTAKIARGMMARYIIKNRLENPEDIKGFSDDGYAFSPENSTAESWLFVR